MFWTTSEADAHVAKMAARRHATKGWTLARIADDGTEKRIAIYDSKGQS
jgi:hypothetical protein